MSTLDIAICEELKMRGSLVRVGAWLSSGGEARLHLHQQSRAGLQVQLQILML